MAKIVRNIEDISKISSNDFLVEIEEIEFVDDSGKSKTFSISAIILVSAKRCTELDNSINWDEKNFHLLVCPGETKIK